MDDEDWDRLYDYDRHKSPAFVDNLIAQADGD